MKSICRKERGKCYDSYKYVFKFWWFQTKSMIFGCGTSFAVVYFGKWGRGRGEEGGGKVREGERSDCVNVL